MPAMRIANRPSFYVILLLLTALVVVTAYVAWKLPEAEELSRQKKNAAPSSFPPYQP